jgi:cytochrome P450
LQKARRFLGTGILTSEAEFHLRQRCIVQPAFHRDRLQDGASIEMDREMMRLTLAIVAKTLFSADVPEDFRRGPDALPEDSRKAPHAG